MPYYQILKQRRLDLNLSIQDVSIQTRLLPEYVRAIEENNLDVFSDDFSYVRYFVHGYCDAIGVNWNMIKDEVDANISACAAARDRALYQAQIKMMQSMQTVKPTRQTVRKTKKKRKKSGMKKSAGKISRTLSWGNQNRLSRLVLICAGCAVVLLAGTNMLAQQAAQKTMAEQKIARQKELQQQEETTQRLADDLKNLKNGGVAPAAQPASAPALAIAKTSAAGVYSISGFQASNPKIHFEMTPASAQDVTILWNDQPAFSKRISQTTSYDLNAGSDGTVTIVFSAASDKNKLSIDGLPIPAEYLNQNTNGQTRLQFQIRYGDPDASGQSLNASSESADASAHVQAADEQLQTPDGAGLETVPDETLPAEAIPGETLPDGSVQSPAGGYQEDLIAPDIYPDYTGSPDYTDQGVSYPQETDPGLPVPDAGVYDPNLPAGSDLNGGDVYTGETLDGVYDGSAGA